MTGQFPRKLSQLRREKGLNQKSAAEKLGVSQALLSHYENGAREPGLDFVVNAAAFYEVSTDFLLGVSDERRPGAGGTDINKALNFYFDSIKTADEKVKDGARNWLALAVWRLVSMVTGTEPGLRKYAELAMDRAGIALDGDFQTREPDAQTKSLIKEAEELIKKEMR